MRVLLAICVLLAGCATPPPPEPAGPSLNERLSSLTIGESTKSDVRAALGEGTVVSFDSGYEVWVYRAPPATELVLLFDPAGVLSKTRR